MRPQTENSGPPFLGLVCSRPNRKPTKGFIQRSEGGPPKTDRIPSHRNLRSHVGFSLFSLSISWKQRGLQVGGRPPGTPTTRRPGPVLSAEEPDPESEIRFHATALATCGPQWSAEQTLLAMPAPWLASAPHQAPAPHIARAATVVAERSRSSGSGHWPFFICYKYLSSACSRYTVQRHEGNLLTHLTELLREAGSPRTWESAWLYLPGAADSLTKRILEFAPRVKAGRTDTEERT